MWRALQGGGAGVGPRLGGAGTAGIELELQGCREEWRCWFWGAAGLLWGCRAGASGVAYPRCRGWRWVAAPYGIPEHTGGLEDPRVPQCFRGAMVSQVDAGGDASISPTLLLLL